MRCKHCGVEIEYSVEDTVFFHKVRTWGIDDPNPRHPRSKEYNNGYFCTEDRKTSADPLGEDI